MERISAETKEKLDEITRKTNEIRKTFNDKLKDYEDGIIDVSAYNATKVKILWILKETDSNFSPVGFFHGRQNIFSKGVYKTWKPVAQCSHILLHDEFSKNNGVLSKTMQEIAAINIKKIPGGKSSSDENIRAFYNDHKNLILKQIELINPDVVIGGNTLRFLKADLHLDDAEQTGFTFAQKNANLGKYAGNMKCKFYMLKERLYIETFHPNR